MPEQDCQELRDFPVLHEAVAERTSDNRINLADDVLLLRRVPEYPGYLDMVVHGDKDGRYAVARVDGVRETLSVEHTANMVRQSPVWENRPIRLMMCNGGMADFAQELANDLRVPVYAPSDILHVRTDGSLWIENEGHWQRFVPVFK